MMEDAKKWYRSKTIWVNLIALGASLLQAKYGLVIDGPTQGMILVILNIILRAVTKEEIVW